MRRNLTLNREHTAFTCASERPMLLRVEQTRILYGNILVSKGAGKNMPSRRHNVKDAAIQCLCVVTSLGLCRYQFARTLAAMLCVP